MLDKKVTATAGLHLNVCLAAWVPLTNENLESFIASVPHLPDWPPSHECGVECEKARQLPCSSP